MNGGENEEGYAAEDMSVVESIVAGSSEGWERGDDHEEDQKEGQHAGGECRI